MKPVSARSAQMRRNGLQVMAFLLVTGALGLLVFMTLGRVDFESKDTYRARFTDVSGLVKGADVRAVGVRVGRVTSMRLLEDDDVEVSFSVSRKVTMTTLTHARVRYANLTGDRYLEISQPAGGGKPLHSGQAIPLSATQPALDLDLLFNGFRPLTKAMDPREVNELTASLIAITQGQAGAVQGLLTHVASFTQELAGRDQLIGEVVDNLSKVLATVDDHRDQVGTLIDGMERLLGGLAQDRKAIGSSLSHVGALTDQADKLLGESGDKLTGTMRQLRRTTDAVNHNEKQAGHDIQLLPKVLTALGRDGAYGSFFNMYICGARIKTTSPTGGVMYTPWFDSKEKRCQF